MWIAIEYSYKLGQKNEFKFWCELGWFLQIQSHIILTMQTFHHIYFAKARPMRMDDVETSILLVYAIQ